MLEGASPSVIQESYVRRHQQTWKLREHHLVITDDSDADSGIDLDLDTVSPANSGDPLNSYFLPGTELTEYWDGLIVREPDCDRAHRYQRIFSIEAQKHESDLHVQDIIIIGEVDTKSLY